MVLSTKGCSGGLKWDRTLTSAQKLSDTNPSKWPPWPGVVLDVPEAPDPPTMKVRVALQDTDTHHGNHEGQ